jgi:hypothetical protein
MHANNMKTLTHGATDVRAPAVSPVFAAIAVALAGCGDIAPDGDSVAEEDTELAVVCGTNVLTGEDGVARTYPEFYYFETINRRLANEPPLREAVGLSQVQNCADARLFAERAAGFERNDLVNHSVSDGIVDLETTTALTPKIHLGESSTKGGVVLLTLPAMPGFPNGTQCSGFYVNPWSIVTSAHCHISTPGNVNIAVEAPGAYGLVYLGRFTRHPDFTGSLDERDDIAVVRLTTSTPHSRQRVNQWPLYIGSTVIGHDVSIFGWGDNVYAGTGAGVLRTGNDFATVNVAESSSNGGYFVGYAGLARICAGDSGGPAGLNVNGVQVAYGVASSGENPFGFSCTYYGYRQFWTKVTSKANWIRDQIGGGCTDSGVVRDCSFVTVPI